MSYYQRGFNRVVKLAMEGGEERARTPIYKDPYAIGAGVVGAGAGVGAAGLGVGSGLVSMSFDNLIGGAHPVAKEMVHGNFPGKDVFQYMANNPRKSIAAGAAAGALTLGGTVRGIGNLLHDPEKADSNTKHAFTDQLSLLQHHIASGAVDPNDPQAKGALKVLSQKDPNVEGMTYNDTLSHALDAAGTGMGYGLGATVGVGGAGAGAIIAGDILEESRNAGRLVNPNLAHRALMSLGRNPIKSSLAAGAVGGAAGLGAFSHGYNSKMQASGLDPGIDYVGGFTNALNQS